MTLTTDIDTYTTKGSTVFNSNGVALFITKMNSYGDKFAWLYAEIVSYEYDKGLINN